MRTVRCSGLHSGGGGLGYPPPHNLPHGYPTPRYPNSWIPYPPPDNYPHLDILPPPDTTSPRYPIAPWIPYPLWIPYPSPTEGTWDQRYPTPPQKLHGTSNALSPAPRIDRRLWKVTPLGDACVPYSNDLSMPLITPTDMSWRRST